MFEQYIQHPKIDREKYQQVVADLLRTPYVTDAYFHWTQPKVGGFRMSGLVPPDKMRSTLIETLNAAREAEGMPPLPFPDLVVPRFQNTPDGFNYIGAESSGRVDVPEGFFVTEATAPQ